MYGGGYGGYGSMYGGMGGMGMGGMGGMGGMYGGMPGDPNDPNSLTNSFGQSTQATFQLIESIVGAFGGFAQMLESTYMATHSSFFGEFPPPPCLVCDAVRCKCACARTVVNVLPCGVNESCSHGVRGRTARKPAEYARIGSGDIHDDSMVPNAGRKSDGSTTTRRRDGVDPVSVRSVYERPVAASHAPRRNAGAAQAVQEAIYHVPGRRLRPALPDGQAHQDDGAVARRTPPTHGRPER